MIQISRYKQADGRLMEQKTRMAWQFQWHGSTIGRYKFKYVMHTHVVHRLLACVSSTTFCCLFARLLMAFSSSVNVCSLWNVAAPLLQYWLTLALLLLCWSNSSPYNNSGKKIWREKNWKYSETERLVKLTIVNSFINTSPNACCTNIQQLHSSPRWSRCESIQ